LSNKLIEIFNTGRWSCHIKDVAHHLKQRAHCSCCSAIFHLSIESKRLNLILSLDYLLATMNVHHRRLMSKNWHYNIEYIWTNTFNVFNNGRLFKIEINRYVNINIIARFIFLQYVIIRANNLDEHRMNSSRVFSSDFLLAFLFNCYWHSLVHPFDFYDVPLHSFVVLIEIYSILANSSVSIVPFIV
jgi:hypothetical protein